MAEVVPKDQKFLDALGGELRPGRDWKVFQRNGNVLLLMPANVRSIRAGAMLYSPQRLLARLVTAAVLKGPFWKVLPGFDWEWRVGSPLETLMGRAGVPVGAILLGNPSQSGRRALILTDEVEPQVLKLGVGSVASELVAVEREFLKSQAEAADSIPEVVLSAGGSGWEAFGINYFEEGPEVSLDELSGTLKTWLLNEPCPMSELPGWEQLSKSVHPEAESIAGSCRDLSLRPSRVHGDLARGMCGASLLERWF